MFTLTFRGPDGSEQTAQLDAELSVGREEGNDLVLPDSAISRKHCRFFVDGNQILVEDLGSSNGVTVDGERIDGPTPVSSASEVFLAEWKVQIASGRPSKVSPRQAGMDGPTHERPAAPRGNGATSKPTRQLTSARPGRALAPANGPEPVERGTKRLPAAQMGAKKAALARPTGPAPRSASIKGLTGPWTGRTFPLSRPVTVIGRSAPADIVVDDDSVSRRHVEIRKTGDGYTVRDLGSANGVFINSDAISEAPLANGDEVRLGVVSFVYSGPGAAKRGLSAKKKRLFLIAGGGGALLVLVLILAVASGSKGGGPTLPVEVVPKQDEGVMGQLSLCKLYSDTDSNDLDWKHAIDACGKVLKLDPLNVEATRLLKVSKRESEQERILKDGKKAAELGHEEEAVEKFLQIDPASYYHRRARQAFLDSRTHILKATYEECRTWSQNGRDWCRAAEECGKYLSFNCCGRDFSEDKKRFDFANKLCYRQIEWSCPEKYCKMIGTAENPVTEEQKMRGLLTAKYHNPKVVDALVGYALQGNARKAADDVERFEKTTAEGQKMDRELNPLVNDLKIVDGRYTTGAPIANTNPDAAAAKFQEAFEADARIMPANATSEMLRRMHRELAVGYLKQAIERMNQGRPIEAAPYAFKAYEQDSSNTDVVELVGKIENGADDYINKGCRGLATARQLLRPNQPGKLDEIRTRWQKLNCGDW